MTSKVPFALQRDDVGMRTVGSDAQLRGEFTACWRVAVIAYVGADQIERSLLLFREALYGGAAPSFRCFHLPLILRTRVTMSTFLRTCVTVNVW